MSAKRIRQFESAAETPAEREGCLGDSLLLRSALYREFLAEREEILRHKWIESEKAGHDIGFERAWANWVTHHRAGWQKARRVRASPGA